LELITPTQAELTNLLRRHVHIVGGRKQTSSTQEAITLVAQVEDARTLDRIALPLLVLAASATTSASAIAGLNTLV
jgi:alpha-beta hydrolase superfamily lysophospholipase